MKEAPKIEQFIKPELSWSESWKQWFKAWEQHYREHKPTPILKVEPVITTVKIKHRSAFLDKLEVFIFSFWIGYFISYLWRSYVWFR